MIWTVLYSAAPSSRTEQYLKAFILDRSLPSGVRGPVDFSALARFAAICRSEALRTGSAPAGLAVASPEAVSRQDESPDCPLFSAELSQPGVPADDSKPSERSVSVFKII